MSDSPTPSSYSQVGQDKWVLQVTGNKLGGTFLDLGSGYPEFINNTVLLERAYNWTGLSIDNDPLQLPRWQAARRLFVLGDASSIVLPPGTHYDYVSIDCDENQLAVVSNFLRWSPRAACLTVEHDSYRFGNEVRDRLRAMLSAAGYTIAVPDVLSDGLPFEDWWIAG